jgi:hypothetical protein
MHRNAKVVCGDGGGDGVGAGRNVFDVIDKPQCSRTMRGSTPSTSTFHCLMIAKHPQSNESIA